MLVTMCAWWVNLGVTLVTVEKMTVMLVTMYALWVTLGVTWVTVEMTVMLVTMYAYDADKDL